VAEGRYIPRRNKAEYPIPEKLNLFLVGLQLASAFALLAFASRTRSPYLLAVLAVCFALVMQMGFALAHEAVHRKLHHNHRLNMGLGIAVFALFPGSIHFFEVAHLLHHRRNRSDDELEDYVLPGERPWFKRLVYFLLISGLFWLLLSVSSVATAMIPLQRIHLPRPDEGSGSFRKFAQFLNGVRPGRVRRDLFVGALMWVTAFPLMHLRLPAVAVCYGVFAFSWASQQYIYHVRTPRHAVVGALDLKLWQPIGWLYLHFNYHLTHHLAVWVPWNHLPAVAAEQPKQSYLKTYFRLWRPPEALDDAWPAQHQMSGPLPPKVDRRSALDAGLPW
jgi:fatty acid desaturase